MAGEQSFGVTFPDWLVDEIEERQERRDDNEAGSVSRSEVIREATALGLVALDELDGTRLKYASTREQRTMVRQAMLDFLDEDDGDPSSE